MSRTARHDSLAEYARAGFHELSDARAGVQSLSSALGVDVALLLEALNNAADPDAALHLIRELATTHETILRTIDDAGWRRLCLLVGASPGLGHFFRRQPESLATLLQRGGRLIYRDEALRALLEAVKAKHDEEPPVAHLSQSVAVQALRIKYRQLLAELVLFDLEQGLKGEAVEAFDSVTISLSGLADAALEAGLAVARRSLLDGINGHAVNRLELDATRLAIVAMGKCGANELNVVSDVDVIFVAESADESLVDADGALRIATRLAAETMRVIHDPALEPPLWQIDANLRPEGKQGPLVRSLGSMLTYYERWAKTWEFQALLKARSAAGDLTLGAQFVDSTRAMVWASSAREDFVGSVQRMRERVTEHIDVADIDVELKLGPGGLRDIEFSVQLLQLVHGQYDETLHSAGTLPALESLVAGGYVAREDGDRLAKDYRLLRVLEHRLQLRDLRRTALMPRDDEGFRVLARSSRLAPGAEQLRRLWRDIRTEVRELHQKIFYAPLLDAVAALPGSRFSLGSDEARARLQSIGFQDPDGAMRHLATLTLGTSRAARIQRNLLPVLLPWLAEGTDPDYGLLAFRRVSEANLSTPWYLRLLRDGSEAAARLTAVLSNSRFASELLEAIPEAVAWLERDELLQPAPLHALLEEMRSLASRRQSLESKADALRAVHRREVLRLALGRLVFVLDDHAVSLGLDAAHTALLDGLLLAIMAEGDAEHVHNEVDIALIAMGRFGGREMGFGSDLDLLAVYRLAEGASADSASDAQRYAERVVADLRKLVDDPRFAVDLDFDLRPEGKNGPLVRSLDAYRAYYERWSLTWEAQALLRARPVAGDERLGADFTLLADEIRYPTQFGEPEIREVRRIKARVEGERLPKGADPKRHLKLGPGGISDVEWLMQLLQLQFAADHPELRVQSTQIAMQSAENLNLLSPKDHKVLQRAWTLASAIRSAIMLWSGRAGDSLPHGRRELEGIAGVLGLPHGSTTQLEEKWLATSRRARRVFEREFFGYSDTPSYPGAG